MTKVESCIVYKQQAQKSDVIFVDKRQRQRLTAMIFLSVTAKTTAVVKMMQLLLTLRISLLWKVCNLFLLIQ